MKYLVIGLGIIVVISLSFSRLVREGRENQKVLDSATKLCKIAQKQEDKDCIESMTMLLCSINKPNAAICKEYE